VLPELGQRPRPLVGGDLDDVRLHEVERLAVDEAGHDGQVREVVVDARHQFLAQQVEVGELEGIEHGQALAEHAVAELHGRPRGEVVGVGAGVEPVAEEVAVDMVEDRAHGHLLQAVQQLAGVVRPPAQVLPQLVAAHEHERRPRLTHLASAPHADTIPRSTCPR
jgi:hypothetical protein